MKAENWIIATGLAFALVVLITVMIPDSLGTNTLRPQKIVEAGAAASLDALNQGTIAMMGAGEPQQVAANTQPAMAGLVPFSKAQSARFQGKVVRVVSLGSSAGWGQLHAWIDEGNGGPSKEVSIAPDWYLMHLGCMVTDNVRVSGRAFYFGNIQTDHALYARNITVGGKTCDLRNDEGFALWSNRLR